jgi:hypothetical protein
MLLERDLRDELLDDEPRLARDLRSDPVSGKADDLHETEPNRAA